ncbi:DUF4292 domain-containing protein [Spongiivirga sp. MCCC 1A20706]|uniref:DUF4292 domain-containing protein n=1 Tax=Spongiivirga sp. MCCC 1A20706 TaxID=3160963 RepID=UPI0039772B1A
MSSKKFIKIIFAVFVILLSGCKATNKVTNTTVVAPLNARKIVKNHYKSSTVFKTLKGRAKVRYEDESRGQTVTANIRIEKGKTIWLSVSFLGIVGAKALITPDQVQYYNKLEKNYFDGDFSLLTDLLGTELTYNQLEDMLMGQAIFDLKDEKLESSVFNRSYKLQSSQNIPLFDKLFFVNSQNFKMAEQRLRQKDKARELSILYPEYQKVKGKILPKKIDIVASENTTSTKIAFEYRSVNFDEDISFPFKIPSGYKEIQIN